MPQPQLLSSIDPLGAIERPACPKCQAQMMLARIVPAFSGTDLHTFECALCNHVLKKLDACRTGAAWGGGDHQALDPVNPRPRSIRARRSAAPP
jgi:hypothetical protein